MSEQVSEISWSDPDRGTLRQRVRLTSAGVVPMGDPVVTGPPQARALTLDEEMKRATGGQGCQGCGN